MAADATEMDIRELAIILWRGKLLIAIVVSCFLLAGLAAYYVAPRLYEASVRISPLSLSRYANYYMDLAATQPIEIPNSTSVGTQSQLCIAIESNLCIFSYTREQLFDQFNSYVQDPSIILSAAQKAGALDLTGLSAEDEQQKKLDFLRSVTFTTPNLTIRARMGTAESSEKVPSAILEEASTRLVEDIKTTALRKIEAGKAQLDAQIHDLRAEIAARKATEEKSRQDRIANLSEQYNIAQSLGLSEPFHPENAPPGNDGQQLPGNTTIVYPGSSPEYLQGTKAIEQQIKVLRERKDGDPFVNGLRSMEENLSLLESNNQYERLLRSVQESVLNDPTKAKVVDIVSTVLPQKTFPKLSLFGAGALLLGLTVGSGIAVLRAKDHSIGRNRYAQGQRPVVS